MKRSLWKVPFIHATFFKSYKVMDKYNRIILRNSFIPATYVNKAIKVYNGQFYPSLDILKSKLGHKMGEYIFTKRCDSQFKRGVKRKKKVKIGKNNIFSMGHIVNAKGMRLGWTQDWCDTWYSIFIIIAIIYIHVLSWDIF